MMDTWLPETCWATIRREIKNTKVTSSWFFLSTLKYFLFQIPESSLFLMVIQYLLTYSSSSYRPCIFHAITCFTKQFSRKMSQIHLAFLRLFVCTMFLSFFTFFNTSFFTRSVQLISLLLQHHISKRSRYFWPTFRTIQVSVPCKVMFQM